MLLLQHSLGPRLTALHNQGGRQHQQQHTPTPKRDPGHIAVQAHSSNSNGIHSSCNEVMTSDATLQELERQLSHFCASTRAPIGKPSSPPSLKRPAAPQLHSPTDAGVAGWCVAGTGSGTGSQGFAHLAHAGLYAPVFFRVVAFVHITCTCVQVPEFGVSRVDCFC